MIELFELIPSIIIIRHQISRFLSKCYQNQFFSASLYCQQKNIYNLFIDFYNLIYIFTAIFELKLYVQLCEQRKIICLTNPILH
jgi:hypothetical protein